MAGPSDLLYGADDGGSVPPLFNLDREPEVTEEDLSIEVQRAPLSTLYDVRGKSRPLAEVGRDGTERVSFGYAHRLTKEGVLTQ